MNDALYLDHTERCQTAMRTYMTISNRTVTCSVRFSYSNTTYARPEIRLLFTGVTPIETNICVNVKHKGDYIDHTYTPYMCTLRTCVHSVYVYTPYMCRHDRLTTSVSLLLLARAGSLTSPDGGSIVRRLVNVLPNGERTAPIYKIHDMYTNRMNTACVPHPNMGTLISHHVIDVPPFAIRPAIEKHKLILSRPYINAKYIEYCVKTYTDIRITLYSSTEFATLAYMCYTHTNIELLRYGNNTPAAHVLTNRDHIKSSMLTIAVERSILYKFATATSSTFDNNDEIYFVCSTNGFSSASTIVRFPIVCWMRDINMTHATCNNVPSTPAEVPTSELITTTSNISASTSASLTSTSFLSSSTIVST